MCPGNVSPHCRPREGGKPPTEPPGAQQLELEEIPTFAKSLTVNGKRIWQVRTWLCSNNQNLSSSISESRFRIWMSCLFSVSVNSWNARWSYFGHEKINCWQQFLGNIVKLHELFSVKIQAKSGTQHTLLAIWQFWRLVLLLSRNEWESIHFPRI